VITSPTGAVIRDILHRLADRFARQVIVWPVRVQGEGAAEEVAAAIEGFNALVAHDLFRRPDLIIVARGGGSIEDLWAFNEEKVARAAAASSIPLISAVGHETDVTLIDFVADMRAPTPTAAAEMAVPVRAELLLRLNGLARRSLACWQRCQEARRTELRAAARALPGAEQLLALPRQRLDNAGARLPRALIANAQIHHARFSRIAGRLGPHVLRARVGRCCELIAALAERARRAETVARARRHERLANVTARLGAGVRANVESHRARIIRARERVASLAERGERAVQQLLALRAASLDHCGQLLNALSHRGVLARGFALIRDLKRRPVRKAAAIGAGMAVDIEFYDGYVRATAEQSFTTPEKPQPTAKSRRRDTGQGSLFG
jgi:exodeoxyribonuclease VII large subunit